MLVAGCSLTIHGLSRCRMRHSVQKTVVRISLNCFSLLTLSSHLFVLYFIRNIFPEIT